MMPTVEERRGRTGMIKSLCKGEAVCSSGSSSCEASKVPISKFTYRMKVTAHSSLLLSFHRP